MSDVRVRFFLAVSLIVSFPVLPGGLFTFRGRVLHAQQPVSRLKGRVIADGGERLANAEVRAEAFFGAAAGTFAGQRTYRTATNAKGEWNILGISPGIWMFDASAPGHAPAAIVLPVRLLTPSSPNAGGQLFLWDLVLKPKRRAEPAPDASVLDDAAAAARAGRDDDALALLRQVPAQADADYLVGAGNVALMAHGPTVARALYERALQIDPSSYGAALGVASTFLLLRDFDGASRAFDAARNRTHDKDEIKFLTYAIGDLQTIHVR